MYGLPNEIKIDLGSTSQPVYPGIFSAKLETIKNETNNDKKYLAFYFNFEKDLENGEDVTGLKYEYREWQVTAEEKDAESKIINQLKRIGAIMIALGINEDTMTAQLRSQHPNYDSFATSFMKFLASHKHVKSSSVEIKLTANFSMDKSKCYPGFPRYTGFIVPFTGKKSLFFSRKEKGDLEEYKNFSIPKEKSSFVADKNVDGPVEGEFDADF